MKIRLMRSRHSFMRRFTAAAVAACFIIQDLSFAQIDLNQKNDLKPKSFSLPQNIGIVKETAALKNPEVIINIKDIHDNFSAQESITHILENLVANYSVKTIGVEGSSGYIDTSHLAALPDAEMRRNTANYLMKEGRLSAGEFFSAMNDEKIAVYGMDDQKLYEENLSAFKECLENKKEYFARIEKLKEPLGSFEDAIYSAELRELERNGILVNNGTLKFSERWKTISSMADKYGIDYLRHPNIKNLLYSVKAEKAVDFKTAGAQRDRLMDALGRKLPKEALEKLIRESVSYKLGRVSQGSFSSYLLNAAREYGLPEDNYGELRKYSDYMLIYETLDIDSLKDEIQEVEEGIRAKIYRNDDERALHWLVKSVSVLSDMLEMKLSSESLRYFKAHRDEFTAARFREFFKKTSSRYGLEEPEADLDAIFAGVPEMMHFYEAAEKRNEALLANTVKRMRENGQTVACLVTGGFHSRGITELLKERQTSYIVILPRYDKKSVRPYLTVVTSQSASYADFARSEQVLETKLRLTAHFFAQVAYRAADQKPAAADAEKTKAIQKAVDGEREKYLKNFSSRRSSTPIRASAPSDAAPKPFSSVPAAVAGAPGAVNLAPLSQMLGEAVAGNMRVVYSKGKVLLYFDTDKGPRLLTAVLKEGQVVLEGETLRGNDAKAAVDGAAEVFKAGELRTPRAGDLNEARALREIIDNILKNDAAGKLRVNNTLTASAIEEVRRIARAKGLKVEVADVVKAGAFVSEAVDEGPQDASARLAKLAAFSRTIADRNASGRALTEGEEKTLLDFFKERIGRHGSLDGWSSAEIVSAVKLIAAILASLGALSSAENEGFLTGIIRSVHSRLLPELRSRFEADEAAGGFGMTPAFADVAARRVLQAVRDSFDTRVRRILTGLNSREAGEKARAVDFLKTTVYRGILRKICTVGVQVESLGGGAVKVTEAMMTDAFKTARFDAVTGTVYWERTDQAAGDLVMKVQMQELGESRQASGASTVIAQELGLSVAFEYGGETLSADESARTRRHERAHADLNRNGARTGSSWNSLLDELQALISEAPLTSASWASFRSRLAGYPAAYRETRTDVTDEDVSAMQEVIAPMVQIVRDLTDARFTAADIVSIITEIGRYRGGAREFLAIGYAPGVVPGSYNLSRKLGAADIRQNAEKIIARSVRMQKTVESILRGTWTAAATRQQADAEVLRAEKEAGASDGRPSADISAKPALTADSVRARISGAATLLELYDILRDLDAAMASRAIGLGEHSALSGECMDALGAALERKYGTEERFWQDWRSMFLDDFEIMLEDAEDDEKILSPRAALTLLAGKTIILASSAVDAEVQADGLGGTGTGAPGIVVIESGEADAPLTGPTAPRSPPVKLETAEEQEKLDDTAEDVVPAPAASALYDRFLEYAKLLGQDREKAAAFLFEIVFDLINEHGQISESNFRDLLKGSGLEEKQIQPLLKHLRQTVVIFRSKLIKWGNSRAESLQDNPANQPARYALFLKIRGLGEKDTENAGVVDDCTALISAMQAAADGTPKTEMDAFFSSAPVRELIARMKQAIADKNLKEYNRALLTLFTGESGDGKRVFEGLEYRHGWLHNSSNLDLTQKLEAERTRLEEYQAGSDALLTDEWFKKADREKVRNILMDSSGENERLLIKVQFNNRDGVLTTYRISRLGALRRLLSEDEKGAAALIKSFEDGKDEAQMRAFSAQHKAYEDSRSSGPFIYRSASGNKEFHPDAVKSALASFFAVKASLDLLEKRLAKLTGDAGSPKQFADGDKGEQIPMQALGEGEKKAMEVEIARLRYEIAKDRKALKLATDEDIRDAESQFTDKVRDNADADHIGFYIKHFLSGKAAAEQLTKLQELLRYSEPSKKKDEPNVEKLVYGDESSADPNSKFGVMEMIQKLVAESMGKNFTALREGRLKFKDAVPVNDVTYALFERLIQLDILKGEKGARRNLEAALSNRDESEVPNKFRELTEQEETIATAFIFKRATGKYFMNKQLVSIAKIRDYNLAAGTGTGKTFVELAAAALQVVRMINGRRAQQGAVLINVPNLAIGEQFLSSDEHKRFISMMTGGRARLGDGKTELLDRLQKDQDESGVLKLLRRDAPKTAADTKTDLSAKTETQEAQKEQPYNIFVIDMQSAGFLRQNSRTLNNEICTELELINEYVDEGDSLYTNLSDYVGSMGEKEEGEMTKEEKEKLAILRRRRREAIRQNDLRIEVNQMMMKGISVQDGSARNATAERLDGTKVKIWTNNIVEVTDDLQYFKENYDNTAKPIVYIKMTDRETLVNEGVTEYFKRNRDLNVGTDDDYKGLHLDGLDRGHLQTVAAVSLLGAGEVDGFRHVTFEKEQNRFIYVAAGQLKTSQIPGDLQLLQALNHRRKQLNLEAVDAVEKSRLTFAEDFSRVQVLDTSGGVSGFELFRKRGIKDLIEERIAEKYGNDMKLKAFGSKAGEKAWVEQWQKENEAWMKKQAAEMGERARGKIQEKMQEDIEAKAFRDNDEKEAWTKKWEAENAAWVTDTRTRWRRDNENFIRMASATQGEVVEFGLIMQGVGVFDVDNFKTIEQSVGFDLWKGYRDRMMEDSGKKDAQGQPILVPSKRFRTFERSTFAEKLKFLKNELDLFINAQEGPRYAADVRDQDGFRKGDLIRHEKDEVDRDGIARKEGDLRQDSSILFSFSEMDDALKAALADYIHSKGQKYSDMLEMIDGRKTSDARESDKTVKNVKKGRRIIFTDLVGTRGNDYQSDLLIVNVNQRLTGGELMQLFGRGGRFDMSKGGTYNVAWANVIDSSVINSMLSDFFQMKDAMLKFIAGPYFNSETRKLFERLGRMDQATALKVLMDEKNQLECTVFQSEWNLIQKKHQAMMRLFTAGLMYTGVTQYIVRALVIARKNPKENAKLIELLEGMNNELFAKEGNSSGTEEINLSNRARTGLETAQVAFEGVIARAQKLFKDYIGSENDITASQEIKEILLEGRSKLEEIPRQLSQLPKVTDPNLHAGNAKNIAEMASLHPRFEEAFAPSHTTSERPFENIAQLIQEKREGFDRLTTSPPAAFADLGELDVEALARRRRDASETTARFSPEYTKALPTMPDDEVARDQYLSEQFETLCRDGLSFMLAKYHSGSAYDAERLKVLALIDRLEDRYVRDSMRRILAYMESNSLEIEEKIGKEVNQLNDYFEKAGYPFYLYVRVTGKGTTLMSVKQVDARQMRDLVCGPEKTLRKVEAVFWESLDNLPDELDASINVAESKGNGKFVPVYVDKIRDNVRDQMLDKANGTIQEMLEKLWVDYVALADKAIAAAKTPAVPGAPPPVREKGPNGLIRLTTDNNPAYNWKEFMDDELGEDGVTVIRKGFRSQVIDDYTVGGVLQIPNYMVDVYARKRGEQISGLVTQINQALTGARDKRQIAKGDLSAERKEIRRKIDSLKHDADFRTKLFRRIIVTRHKADVFDGAGALIHKKGSVDRNFDSIKTDKKLLLDTIVEAEKDMLTTHEFGHELHQLSIGSRAYGATSSGDKEYIAHLASMLGANGLMALEQIYGYHSMAPDTDGWKESYKIPTLRILHSLKRKFKDRLEAWAKDPATIREYGGKAPTLDFTENVDRFSLSDTAKEENLEGMRNVMMGLVDIYEKNGKEYRDAVVGILQAEEPKLDFATLRPASDKSPDDTTPPASMSPGLKAALPLENQIEDVQKMAEEHILPALRAVLNRELLNPPGDGDPQPWDAALFPKEPLGTAAGGAPAPKPGKDSVKRILYTIMGSPVPAIEEDDSKFWKRVNSALGRQAMALAEEVATENLQRDDVVNFYANALRKLIKIEGELDWSKTGDAGFLAAVTQADRKVGGVYQRAAAAAGVGTAPVAAARLGHSGNENAYLSLAGSVIALKSGADTERLKETIDLARRAFGIVLVGADDLQKTEEDLIEAGLLLNAPSQSRDGLLAWVYREAAGDKTAYRRFARDKARTQGSSALQDKIFGIEKNVLDKNLQPNDVLIAFFAGDAAVMGDVVTGDRLPEALAKKVIESSLIPVFEKLFDEIAEKNPGLSGLIGQAKNILRGYPDDPAAALTAAAAYFEKEHKKIDERIDDQFARQYESELKSAGRRKRAYMLSAAGKAELDKTREETKRRENKIPLPSDLKAAARDSEGSTPGSKGPAYSLSDWAQKLTAILQTGTGDERLQAVMKLAGNEKNLSIMINGNRLKLADWMKEYREISAKDRVKFSVERSGSLLILSVVAGHGEYAAKLPDDSKDPSLIFKPGTKVSYIPADVTYDDVQERVRNIIWGSLAGIAADVYREQNKTALSALPDEAARDKAVQVGLTWDFVVTELRERFNYDFDRRVEIATRLIQDQGIPPSRVFQEIHADCLTLRRVYQLQDKEFKKTSIYQSAVGAAKTKLSQIHKDAKNRASALGRAEDAAFLSQDPDFDKQLIPIDNEMWDQLQIAVPDEKGRIRYRSVGEGVKEVALWGAGVVLLPADPSVSENQLLGLLLHEGGHLSVDFQNKELSEGLTEWRAREMLRELKGDSAVREYMALAGKGSDFGLYSDEVAVVRGQLEARFTAGGVIDWASIDLARFTGNPALLTPGSAVLSPGTKPRFESRRGKVIKIFEELKAGSILIPVPGEDASLQIADGVTMTQLADALQNDPQKIALFFENWNSAHRGLGDVMTQLAALLPKPVADACEPADFMHAFREGRKAGKDLAAIAYDLEMQTGIEPTLKLLTAAGLYIPPATDKDEPKLAPGFTITKLIDALASDPRKLAVFFELHNEANKGLGALMMQAAQALPKPIADIAHPIDFLGAVQSSRNADGNAAEVERSVFRRLAQSELAAAGILAEENGRYVIQGQPALFTVMAALASDPRLLAGFFETYPSNAGVTPLMVQTAQGLPEADAKKISPFEFMLIVRKAHAAGKGAAEIIPLVSAEMIEPAVNADLTDGGVLTVSADDERAVQIGESATMAGLLAALGSDPRKLEVFFEGHDDHVGIGGLMAQTALALPPEAAVQHPQEFMIFASRGHRAGKTTAAIIAEIIDYRAREKAFAPVRAMFLSAGVMDATDQGIDFVRDTSVQAMVAAVGADRTHLTACFKYRGFPDSLSAALADLAVSAAQGKTSIAPVHPRLILLAATMARRSDAAISDAKVLEIIQALLPANASISGLSAVFDNDFSRIAGFFKAFRGDQRIGSLIAAVMRAILADTPDSKVSPELLQRAVAQILSRTPASGLDLQKIKEQVLQQHDLEAAQRRAAEEMRVKLEAAGNLIAPGSAIPALPLPDAKISDLLAAARSDEAELINALLVFGFNMDESVYLAAALTRAPDPSINLSRVFSMIGMIQQTGHDLVTLDPDVFYDLINPTRQPAPAAEPLPALPANPSLSEILDLTQGDPARLLAFYQLNLTRAAGTPVPDPGLPQAAADLTSALAVAAATDSSSPEAKLVARLDYEDILHYLTAGYQPGAVFDLAAAIDAMKKDVLGPSTQAARLASQRSLSEAIAVGIVAATPEDLKLLASADFGVTARFYSVTPAADWQKGDEAAAFYLGQLRKSASAPHQAEAIIGAGKKGRTLQAAASLAIADARDLILLNKIRSVLEVLDVRDLEETRRLWDQTSFLIKREPLAPAEILDRLDEWFDGRGSGVPDGNAMRAFRGISAAQAGAVKSSSAMVLEEAMIAKINAGPQKDLFWKIAAKAQEQGMKLRVIGRSGEGIDPRVRFEIYPDRKSAVTALTKSGIPPESIAFAFGAAVQDTPQAVSTRIREEDLTKFRFMLVSEDGYRDPVLFFAGFFVGENVGLGFKDESFLKSVGSALGIAIRWLRSLDIDRALRSAARLARTLAESA